MQSLAQDLKLAMRRIGRYPAISFAIIATLTLSIGASVATFSIVSGVLLHPLPYPEPDRLLVLAPDGVSIPDGVDWRERSHTLRNAALFLPTWDFDLTGRGAPERLDGAVIEPRLFRVLGVHAELGRDLSDANDRAGGPHVAVIARGLWVRRFGADPQAIGRTITLNGAATTIVGVMPAEADVFGTGVQVWVPQAIETPWAATSRGSNNFAAIGRLAPATTLEAGRAELLTISRALAAKYPDTNEGKLLAPVPILDALVGQVRSPLVLLLAAVSLALLLAAANLAGLLLARAESRRDEIAVRLALGGGRRRIVRQLVTEGAVLVGVGAALGTLLAAMGRDLLVALAPASLPRAAEIGIDWRVLAFAVIAAAVTGALCSALPALVTVPSSRARRAAPRSRTFLRGLVVGELTAGLVLVSGAALLARSLFALERVNLGFDPARVVTADLVLPEARYGVRERQTAAFLAAVRALAVAPGVEAAGSGMGIPLSGNMHVGYRFAINGRPPLPAGQDGAADRPVTGEYFRAMGLPLLSGRTFTESDRAGTAPVAVVNQTFARQYWPGASALGAHVHWVGIDGGGAWMTVVGVVGNAAGAAPTTRDAPAIYVPYAQRTEQWQRFGTLVVRLRAGLDPAAGAALLRDTWARVDPDVPLAHVGPMTRRRADSIAQPRFNALALGVFALGALILAVQGVYGTVSYVVEQRRREFGVRVAIGATALNVVRIVMRDAAAMALGGIALGTIGALAATRALGSLLYGVGASDPATHAAAAAALAAAALVGAYVPARRAGRADAAQSLRGE